MVDRRGRIPYLPALDGLRAIALVVVLAFHGGFSFVSGGYLPLTSFFVLSGFLITALLLAERGRSGSTSLRGFWERRIRRLAPAAVLGIVLVTLYLHFGADYPNPSVRGDAISSALWVTNWRFILDGQVYADAFHDPSPLQHYWSLAVEEQFYLVLPLLFVGTMVLCRGRRWLLAGLTALLATASTVWMAHLHEPGDPPLRAYFGTDTRAAELLIGVLLALVLVDRAGSLRSFGGIARRGLDVAGTVALGITLGTWILVREYDDRLYEGGLAIIALLAAVVVAAATQPGSTIGRLLGLRPLVWLGKLSYGIYIFHWPIFLWVDEASTGLATGPLFVVRMAITLGLAWLSLRFVERPIREGRMPLSIGVVGWANASIAIIAVLALTTSSLGPAITLTAGAQEGELPPPPPSVPDTVPSTTTQVAPSTTATTTTTAPSSTTVPTKGSRVTAAPSTTVAPATTVSPPPPPTTEPLPPVRVMVAGDSIAKNLATGLLAWQDEGAPIIVYDASINGCTISRGGVRHIDDGQRLPIPESCGWWATNHLTDALSGFRPDVVVVHSSHNETFDRSHPSWLGVRSPGDETFDSFIASEWRGAADRFGSSGATVLWADSPCVQSDRYNEYLDPVEANRRSDYFNENMIPGLVAASRIQVLGLDSQLCPGGGWSDVVAGVSNARPDGFHLSDVAATALAKTWLGPEILAAAGR